MSALAETYKDVHAAVAKWAAARAGAVVLVSLSLVTKGVNTLQEAYTRLAMADKGAFHSIPNHWFNLGAVHELVPDRLELATVLRVYGAFEDPNRRVEARPLAVDPMTGSSAPGDRSESVAVQPYETVIDRVPPAAELQVGLRWHARDDAWELQGTLYNAFNNERYAYDNSDDLEPRLEIVPSTFEGFRFFVSATHRF
jgi:hypothetical protein